MKMQDSDSEKELANFFLEMKEKDRKKEVPPFPIRKNPKLWYLIPIGIAASLALFAWFNWGDKSIQSLEYDVIIITLEEGQNNELQFKIESTTELESWESPTASLLTEF